VGRVGEGRDGSLWQFCGCGDGVFGSEFGDDLEAVLVKGEGIGGSVAGEVRNGSEEG
jgi:hypothetical protein